MALSSHNMSIHQKLESLFDWFKKNIVWIGTLTATVLVLVAGYGIYQWQYWSQKTERQKELSELIQNNDLDKLRGYFEKHQSNEEGLRAGMHLANQSLQNDQLDEAQPLLDTVEKQAKRIKSDFYLYLSSYLLSQIFIQKEQYDQALTKLDQALTKAPEKLKNKVRLLQLQTHVIANQMEEAKKILETNFEDDSDEAKEARGIGIAYNL